jgi:hypothetical protein
MGVAVSTHTQISPIGLASTIIGFVSFIFTVGTATRVFWAEISTFYAAGQEIDDALTNLKQGLYEEKYNLKRARRIRARRRSRSLPLRGVGGGSGRDGEEEERDAALRAMTIALKHMIRRFKELEKPFLAYPDESGRPKYSGDEDGYSDEDWRDDATNLYYHPEYNCDGFKSRIAWLSKKGAVTAMADSLVRLTVRRIGIQTTIITSYALQYPLLPYFSDVARSFRELGRDINEFDDRMHDIGQRLSRVVGVRRVE